MTSGTTEDLNRVWGTSADDIFAVGRNGTVLHYDGTSWTPMQSGTTETLEGVWGASSSDVYVTGENGTILHYDGASWSPMQSGTTENLGVVWGTSSSDVFVAALPGYAGQILHYDGTSWSPMQQRAWGVWGSSPDDVWAVSGEYAVYYYDGIRWTVAWRPANYIASEGLSTIWGTSSTDVWVAGNAGVALHYDGMEWSGRSPYVSNAFLQKRRFVYYYGLWASSPSDAYIMGCCFEFSPGRFQVFLHWDGDRWDAVDLGTSDSLEGMWGSSPNDLYVVGSNGVIIHGR
jgi:hypothetical protein